MWTKNFIRLVLFFSVIYLGQIHCDPIYTIIAPSKLRPNSDYHLSIQLENSTQSATFDVTISGPSTQSHFNRIDTSVTVRPYESRIINLEIGEWSKGNYKLIVKGHTNGESLFKFSNETDLEFNSKSYSIFVQTDKAVYKPGQTVRFRAIIVNPSLIPNLAGSLDIYIKDPKENLIKQWKRIFTHRGVVSEELPLSEQPPLGDWSIIIDVAGQKSKKTFSVAEYILPTFSVDIFLPSYATYNKSDVIATIKATYTYGKPVKGDVTLTVQPRIRHTAISFRPLEQYQTKIKLEADGKVDISVNIVRDLNLKTDFFEREIEFFALVEETLTGRKYNKSSVLKIYHKEVKIKLMKTSKTFKPGLKYTAFLKVAYQDDTPVDDDGPPVKIRYGYSYNEDHWNETIEKVPRKGLVQIDLYPPKHVGKIGIIGLRAEYRGQVYFLESINKAHSPSMNFIEIVQKNADRIQDIFNQKPIRVGDELTFVVNATEPFKNLVYEVIAKGDIVLARNIQSQPRSAEEIIIPITHRMTPKARVLVYYIRDENQEIVADAFNFNVDGTFKTPVALSSNVNQTKPGGEVNIRVNTKPSAYVGLLGVDQSVLLLKSGFDISQHDVIKELESYDSGKRSHDDFGSSWFGRWSWSSATTAGEIFDDSGVIILTNSLLHRHVQARLGKRIFYTADGGVIVSKQKRPEIKPLAAIRLDDTILEDHLQPPDFKISSRSESRIVLRKTFPETWIWANVTTGNDGVARYSDSIPDTITSWYVSAFAVDSITGLGIAPDTLKINVFRPFFIKLSIPYSIIRGESVSIQTLIFNYQNKPVKADVIMENPSDEFEFTNAANEIEFAGNSNVQEKRKTVTIGSYDGVSVSYLITPKKLGYINIRIRATTDNAGDAIIQKLLVKPGGQTQYFNKAMFVNAVSHQASTNRVIIKRNVSVDIPPNAVPGSVRIMVSGISDILGPTVNHLDDLLRMPYGCGEQNMINLVPNIVVSDYLKRVNRITEAIRTKVKRHIETGYQQELTYRRDDGSFSAFGQNDKAGSTWLTAFVVKTFIQARPHIDVDNGIISNSIEWLLTRQKKDGSFAEYGEVHNKALQGGSAVKIKTSDNSTDEPDNVGALTAFVLIAILHESKLDSVRSRNDFALQRSAEFIYSRVASSTSPYEVAIGTYALHVADSPHKDFAYKKLMAMVTRDQDGLMYWSMRPDDQQNNKSNDRLKVFASDYLLYPNAIDIEATSYAILTMAARSEIDQAIPALRWLITKQNSNGGFSSTQDTVIGLQALGAIAERISTATVKLAVNIKHGNDHDGTIASGPQQALYFNTDNALVLQQIQLDPETKWVELEATGFGTAIIQVSYQYNLAVSAEKPAFFLNPQKDKTSTENYLQLSICTYYKDGNSTNMAVMEVELPSGYNADVDALPAATRAKEVKRVDTTNNDGTVIVYLDRVTRDELCITVPAHRTHHVANNKPVPVTIYDYYDRSKLSRIFYEPTLVTFCDICPQNELDCKTRCAHNQHRQQRQRAEEPRFGSSSFESFGRYGEVDDLLDPNSSPQHYQLSGWFIIFSTSILILIQIIQNVEN